MARRSVRTFTGLIHRHHPENPITALFADALNETGPATAATPTPPPRGLPITRACDGLTSFQLLIHAATRDTRTLLANTAMTHC